VGCKVGWSVGAGVGARVGVAVVGTLVGTRVGATVGGGMTVGALVGDGVGVAVGAPVGDGVGAPVGVLVGGVGVLVGARVGATVGTDGSCTHRNAPPVVLHKRSGAPQHAYIKSGTPTAHDWPSPLHTEHSELDELQYDEAGVCNPAPQQSLVAPHGCPMLGHD
jgi:hypothetical protein